MLHVLLLLGCAVAIYLSCEWFVNAVEWLGVRLRVGPLAVGTVLAAFGTALPESVVTFVAVVFGRDDASRDIGVGAAMGGPLVLATLGYGVTGAMLLLRGRSRRRVLVSSGGGTGTDPTSPNPAEPGTGTADLGDPARLARDQTWFLYIFVVKVGLGLLAFAVKPWLGLAFFAAYGVYFWREIRAGDRDAAAPELEPLKLQPRRATPATWAILVQSGATVAVIYLASQVFVGQLHAVGPALGLPATVTALLLAPVATELPEIMNAIIWVRQGKTALALANISGAMMIQATVPSGLGLLFTPWRFDAALIAAGLATMLAIGYQLALLRRNRLTAGRLCLAALPYLAFGAAQVRIVRPSASPPPAPAPPHGAGPARRQARRRATALTRPGAAALSRRSARGGRRPARPPPVSAGSVPPPASPGSAPPVGRWPPGRSPACRPPAPR